MVINPLEIVELPIEKVIVINRFRKVFVDIDKLAVSIEKQGLINPIIIDENLELIAGERRYKAHQHLGKATIKCIIKIGLSNVQKKEMELSENVDRNNFTYIEECLAIKLIHELRQEQYGTATKGHQSGGWTLANTADSLGKSVGSVTMDKQLAGYFEIYPQLTKEINKSSAHKLLKKLLLNEIEQKRADAAIKKGLSRPDLINGNCIEEMSKIPSGSIDLIVTDPPYGIDLDKTDYWSGRVDVYKDNPHDVANLIDLAIREMFRVLKFNSHIYIFYPANKYQMTIDMLTRTGFKVFPFPMIWNKEGASYPGQQVMPMMSYETFLFAVKGDKKLNKDIMTILTVPRVPHNQKIHPVERPIQLLRQLIEVSSDVGDTVFDPFAGSAVCLQAAYELNRKAIGIELDKAYYNLAVERLNKNFPAKTLEMPDGEVRSYDESGNAIK